jgi:hypothetical protein
MTDVCHRLPRLARPAALLALLALVGCTPAPADPKPAEPPKADAPKPGTADKWAGIEVGSKGVKPIVMGFTKSAEGWDFTADTTFESKNTDLGTLAEDNSGFDPQRVAATIAAVADLDKAIREKHQLPGDRVKVVFSSGVFTRFKDKEKAAAGRAQLTAAVEKAVGRAPDFITESQEAELAFRGIISPAGRTGRLLIDIGSGNARFGWYAGDAFKSFTVDAGTKLVRDAITKEAAAKKQSFAEAVPAVRKTLLDAPLAEKVKAAKGFDAVKDVFVIGGAAWALSTFTHPGTGDELRVPLTAADVEQFAELARHKPEDVRAKAAGVSDKAGKEVERVQKVFTPEDLQAAAEILRAFFAEAKLADRKVAFFQKGQYAWMAGYLMAAAKLPD